MKSFRDFLVERASTEYKKRETSGYRDDMKWARRNDSALPTNRGKVLSRAMARDTQKRKGAARDHVILQLGGKRK